MPKFVDNLNVQGAATISGVPADTTQVLKLATGQTQPFLEFEDSIGTVLSSVDVTGSPNVPQVTTTGLTGANAASRYVGATTSGAPTAGTFAVGDFVIDQTGKVWICTTAGSPGSWTSVGASGSGLTQVATTGASGYTLVNSTGTILSWTAPNDGNPHVFIVFGQVVVSSATTGGLINLTWTDFGGSHLSEIFAPGLSVGSHATANSATSTGATYITVEPGSTVSLTQASAMTAGAAILYAVMMGS